METSRNIFWPVVVMLVVAGVVGCGRAEETTPGQSRFPDGWMAGPSETFVGDELFTLINGGAEIYHEYGFESVEVQEHERGDERISVEVYTMTGDAFGIYSWARSSGGEPVDMGAGGTLADYYLHLWSGPHLVVLTAQNPGPDPQGAVLDLGRRIGARYPKDGSIPKLMGLIPADHCPDNAATYFVGPIAFNNVAPRLAPYFSGFDDGVAAECPVSGGEAEHIVFLRWTDPARAVHAIEAAERRLETTEGARFEAIADTPADGERLEFIDKETFTVIFDTGLVADGRRVDHILRLTVADGHRPQLDELPFWSEPSRRPS